MMQENLAIQVYFPLLQLGKSYENLIFDSFQGFQKRKRMPNILD